MVIEMTFFVIVVKCGHNVTNKKITANQQINLPRKTAMYIHSTMLILIKSKKTYTGYPGQNAEGSRPTL